MAIAVTAPIGYRGTRGEILTALKMSQPLTAKELADKFGVTPNALRRHLKELENEGIVRYQSEIRGVGGPVFTPRGEAVGLTSMEDPSDRAADVRVVPAAEICAVLGPVKDTIAATPPPSTPLPVEPERPFSIDALKAAVERRAGSLNPYQMSSSAFDIAFITPINTYGAQYTADQMRRRRTTSQDTRAPEPEAVRPLMEFSNWSEYVWEFPPVLLVRVTPKLVEGFWTMVARGAARTQGVAIPPIKRVTSGFLRLQAFCGPKKVELTDREFEILHCLAERAGQVVTRDQLLHLVWGYSDAPLTRTVDNFIFRLRHKLEPDPRHPTYIRKAYGDGYRLITE